MACGQAAAHENGHGLSLYHQSDYTGSTLINEYSLGNDNNSPGTYAPIMALPTTRNAAPGGLATQTTAVPTKQNDVAVLLSNSGIGGFVNDGIGHTLATATPMPVTGTTVDCTKAKGIITPASTSSPTPIGVSNYTTDYFMFHSNGGQVLLPFLMDRSI